MNDGGPAFPVPYTHFDTWVHGKYPIHGHPGLSLRDWFAGMAMQSLDRLRVAEQAKANGISPSMMMAQISYGMADAMIAARDSKQH